MRQFTMVSPRVWRSQRFKDLSRSAQLAYLYLLTSEHQNMAGVYRLPPAYAGSDLGWTVDEFTKALEEVVAVGLAHRDEDTDEVMIAQWFKFNEPKGKTTIKGVENTLDKIESETLYELAMKAFEDAINLQAEKNVQRGQEQTPTHSTQLNGMAPDQLLNRKRDLRLSKQQH